MFGAALVPMLLDLVPLVFEGVSGAMDLYKKGATLFNKVNAEQREPTWEEMQEISNLRKAFYDDFYKDDPDETTA